MKVQSFKFIYFLNQNKNFSNTFISLFEFNELTFHTNTHIRKRKNKNFKCHSEL